MLRNVHTLQVTLVLPAFPWKLSVPLHILLLLAPRQLWGFREATGVRDDDRDVESMGGELGKVTARSTIFLSSHSGTGVQKWSLRKKMLGIQSCWM